MKYKRRFAIGFLLLVFILNTNIVITVICKVSTRDSMQILTTETITGFNGFTQYEDSDYVESSISDQKIDISVSYAIKNTYEYEAFELAFEEGSDISTFDIKVEASYLYTGSMLESLWLIAGSHSQEDGSYSSNFYHIALSGLVDAWIQNNGHYNLYAYPNQNLDQNTFGQLSGQKTITLHIIRTSISLISSIEESGSTLYSVQWEVSNGLTRALDYILVGFYCHPNYISTTTVEFSSFTAILNSTGEINITNNPTTNSNWYIWLLISGSIIIVLVISMWFFVKRKEKHLKDRTFPVQKSVLNTNQNDNINKKTSSEENDLESYSWFYDEKE